VLHKSRCNNINSKNYNSKVYETIRTNGGFDNWIMEIVEVFPCEGKRDLCIREQWYINSAKGKINSVRAFTTPEERKVSRKETSKQFYLANKDKMAEQKKQYSLAQKVEIAEKHRQYRLVNKDKIAEYQKQYDLANRDKRNEQRKSSYLKKKEGEKIESI
jgi:hypothetical protein